MKIRTLLPFICLLALLCAPAALANPVLTIGNASGIADTSVTVSVTASGLSNADRWSFGLVYDKSLVNFVSADRGAATKNWFSVLGSGSNGTLTVTGRAGVSGTTLGSGNLQLCTITFRIKPGITASTVNLVPFSPTDGLNRASLNPGYISITTLSPLVLTIGSPTGAPDKDVITTVTADGLNKASGWRFNLAYNTRFLNFTSIKAGTAVSAWPSVGVSGLDGQLLVVGSAGPSGAPVTGNKKQLALLTFHVKPGLSQATTTTIALTPSNPADGLKGAALKAGKVTIPQLTPLALKIGSTTGAADTSVTVQVKATSLAKADHWSFNLRYDQKKLIFVGVDPSLLKNWLSVTGSAGSGGNLFVSGRAGSQGTVLNGNATLCAVTFHVKPGLDPSTTTTLVLTPATPAYGLSGAKLTTGSITIPPITPLSLKLPSVSGTPDKDVTVAVTASGLKNATFWSFKLAYDQSKLSFVKLASGTATAKWGAFNATGANGNLTLAAQSGAAAPLSGDNQQIGVLTLHVKPGVTSATVSLVPSAPAGALKNAALTAGQVKVAALPSLTIGTGAGDVGATVPISVTAGTLSDPRKWSFRLTYDPATLRFVSVKPGTATRNWILVNARDLGHGVLAVSGQAGPSGTPISNSSSGNSRTSSNPEICQLSFAIKAGPGTTSALTPSAPGDGLTSATLKAGSIKVNGNIPLQLALGRVTGSVGTDVVVPTTATGLSGSTAWGLDVSFDSSKLSYVAVQKGKATAKWSSISGLLIAPGKVRITGSAGPNGSAVSGSNQELVKITFHVNSGQAGSVLTLTPSNPVVGLNGASLTPGKITLVKLIPTLALGSASGTVGANVTVPATATDLSGSKAWGFDVAYDAKKLTYVAVQKGAATQNWASVTGKIVSGKLRITGSAGTAGSGVSGNNQELCKITFKIAAGSAGASLTLTPSNPTQDLSGAKLNAGKVTIVKSQGSGTGGGGGK